jgi:hypothetical protein
MFNHLRRVLGRHERVESHPEYLDAAGIVDVVSCDQTVVTLWLIVNYPWTIDGTYSKLNEKLNHYVSFIEDGEISRENPQFGGKRRRICIQSMYPLTAKIMDMLPHIRSLLLSHTIDLVVMVADEKNNRLVELPIAP